MKKHIWGVLISIAIAELVGALSGLVTGNIKRVYESLALPLLSPPGWLFPIAWGILYALMGIAAYLVYSAAATRRKKSKALTVYALQLFVNFIWTPVFFPLQWFGVGVILSLLLVILASATMLMFWELSRPAGYLLVPYILWLLFALYLSIVIFRLN